MVASFKHGKGREARKLHFFLLLFREVVGKVLFQNV